MNALGFLLLTAEEDMVNVTPVLLKFIGKFFIIWYKLL